MTSPTVVDLISRAEAAGLTFAISGGRVAIQYPKDNPPSPDLLSVLRERKDDIRCALAHSPGWGGVPDQPLALADVPDRLRLAEIDLLTAHLFRQGNEALNWTLTQGLRYFSERPDWNTCQCDMTACLDLLLWQRSHRQFDTRAAGVRDLLGLLEGIEEGERHLPQWC